MAEEATRNLRTSCSMPDRIQIQPTGPLTGSVRPPGSKSITNRALVCAALAAGKSTLHGALDSEDTQVMIDGLRRLGVGVQYDRATTSAAITGCDGEISTVGGQLYVGNSGTTVRFLTAVAALGQGTYRLDGSARMRDRPIGDLLDGLNQLGVNVVSDTGNGCPPVTVRADGIAGGAAVVGGDISSQFLSGLLMVGPYAKQDIELRVRGPLVSQPYVRMTVEVMSAFGVRPESSGLYSFQIPAGTGYQGCRFEIEPDASAASYFWAAAAITGGAITVQGLSRDALQGDVDFCDCLARMGCDVTADADGITVTGKPLAGIDIDMNAISDTVQTLAAVAMFAEGPTTISGVAHIRHKETDRIGDLARELRRLGASVEEFSDGLKIIPEKLRGGTVETYDDHRMAMSLALVGLKIPGVVIKDPDCTAKTYPDFFRDLAVLAANG